MRDRYVLVPGLSGTELLRSLAAYGCGSIGMHIVGAAELAEEALALSCIPLGLGILPSREEASVFDSFLREIPYFSGGSYADAESAASAVRGIRGMSECEEDAFDTLCRKGEFREKNEAIRTAYRRFLEKCRDSGLIDGISIVRKAAAEALPIDADFLCLEEYPLTKLETLLLERVSGGKYEKVPLVSLFGREKAGIKTAGWTNGYGIINECENIIDEIVESGVPFDSCTVAVSAPGVYSQTFYDISMSRGIPMTFGCGVPVINSNPAKLLKLVSDWNGTGCNGTDALKRILTFEGFDRTEINSLLGDREKGRMKAVCDLAKIAGRLRIGTDPEINKERIDAFEASLSPGSGDAAFIPAVRYLADEFSGGYSSFIKSHSVMRDGHAGRIDRSAVSVITECLDSYGAMSDGSDLESVVSEMLRKTVCSENSRPGALFVTGIPAAAASLRKNLFIAGLSADRYPGNPSEDHLILDSDWLLLGDGDEVPTSENRVNERKRQLNDLVTLASSLSVPVRISWPGYSLSDLKKLNPSSSVFDIYSLEKGDGASVDGLKKDTAYAGYFDARLSPARYVGRAYAGGKDLESGAAPKEKIKAPRDGAVFSPTAVEIYMQCPRHFYLTKILGIREPEEDDPFCIIAPNDFGTLAHDLMEKLAENGYTRDEFLAESGRDFDRFLISRPPVYPSSAERVRELFMKTMANAFDQDPGNEVTASESDVAVVHESGIPLGGRCDRVEKGPDGKYIIVDFKTGTKIKHRENDPETCIQALIYAYLFERQGLSVSHCEYRYLKDGVTVGCSWDDDKRKYINDLMERLRSSIESGSWPCAPSADSCRYCSCQGFCGKEGL